MYSLILRPPRMPPAELISSAASCTPCTVEVPNAASEPVSAPYTPTGISPVVPAVWASRPGRQAITTSVPASINRNHFTIVISPASLPRDRKDSVDMNANDIRKGMVIMFDGDLCKVMDFRHHTPGNLRAMVQAKLRNLRTGNQFEHRFRSNDDIEQAYISQHEMEYMYSDGHAHHFMNTENYEQVEISEDDLGDSAAWLAPGVKLQVQFHEGRPLGIELPKTVKAKIIETQPMVKG